ncbi:MAG: polyketide synthase dehydratase domain-containing protein, partial [Cyanobacteria bacterium J06607_6]
MTLLTEQGIKTQSLIISHAFHSALMEPMLAEFRAVANQVNYALPQRELVSNVTGQVAAAEMATADYWVRHVRQPVQFATGMQTLAAQGYNTLVEIGAKPVLLAMGRACLPDFEALWLPGLRPDADWQTLLTSLGELYIADASINWTALDQAVSGQRVSLPTYPFQRQRYWADIDIPSLPHSPISSSPHPLLGTQLNLPRTNTIHFESHISSNTPAYLTDHQVFGAVVLPAAGFIEMAIAALRSTQTSQALALKAVTIHQALVLNQPQTVQVLLLPREDQLYQFEILSLADADWVLHASGQVMEAALENPVDLAQLQSHCDEFVAVEACYQRLADQGVTYGDRFRAIKKLWQGNSEVLSQLQLPAALHSTATVYQLHPVLLDACLQSLAAVFLDQPGSDTYLPAGVAEVHIQPGIDWAQADYQLWCHAQVQSGDRDITADLQLFLNDGQPVGTLIGLKLRPATSDRVLGPPQFQDWLYHIDWQAQPLPQAATPAEFLLSPAAICHQIAPALADLLNQPEVNAYQQVLPELEALSRDYIQRAIATLKDPSPTAETDETAPIAPQHEALYQRFLEKVQGARSQGLGQHLVPCTLNPAPSIASAEHTLLTRCGENLAAVLRGEIDPLTLLFPNGDLSDLTRLYESSVGAQVMNSLVQRVVTAAMARSHRPLRILEIGAGTGGTTAHLLPHLPDGEYVFTDVSPLFLAKARERFQEYGGVRYELLNIERSPAAQGFQQSFDLVIAANILHATADLRQTLMYVHELLAPGGELILLESTRPLLWLDLIFGLTEGWWKFSDRDLRPDYPLLSAEQWQTLLAESGFTPAILQPAAE